MIQRRFATELASLTRSLRPFSKDEAWVVACSGGLDSMVLLDLVLKASRKYPATAPKLVACYIDHSQRPDTQDDLALVSDYCRRNDLVFATRKLAVAKGAGEQTLRAARYAALTETAKGLGARVIFTGHHAEDELETLIFRLLRGAHPETIRGVPRRARRDGVTVLRPLLGFTKDDLQSYAKDQGVPWREDATNASPKYARNRIRRELLPLLESLRPGARAKLRRFFTELRALQPAKPDAKAVRKGAEALKRGEGLAVKGLEFLQLKSVVDVLLADQAGRTSRAQWQALRAILSERQATRTGGGPVKVVQFPGGYCLTFAGSTLYWTRSARPTERPAAGSL